MAAPMAVSSWNTGVDFLSRGSTVFSFLISGSFSAPPLASSFVFSARRLSHKLLVLKKRWRDTSWKEASSALGHCALSRSSSRSSAADAARWPPFLSAAVRCAHSMRNGKPLSAKCARRSTSRVAPRLSEFDTNKYSIPRLSRSSSMPLPASAA